LDQEIAQIIADHGAWFYPITFIWAFLEGETFVIFAGAASYQGLLNVYFLIAAAWAGSFCGDQFYFFIGRRYGHRVLKRFPTWQGPVDMALGLLHKYHVGFILSFRFIYGVRNFSSFAMGMSELPWIRFFILNFIAAGLWATTFAFAGYLLGQMFEAVLGDIARDFGLVMLGVFIVVLSGLVWLHKRGKKMAAKAAEPKIVATVPLTTKTVTVEPAVGDLPIKKMSQVG
jgi:membrane protein DedA with SNARE-associated domain